MAQLSHARQEPMFRDFSLNRADIATDLAIPLLAEGGWPAMTLASIAARGNMKRQSVAQWFGNVEAMREQVAWRFIRRWLMLLSARLTPLHRAAAQGDRPDAATVARMLLPADDDGIAFDRIWLAICEAGRSDLGIAAATTFGESEQLAMVASWLPGSSQPAVRAVCALVTGLRAQLCAAEPITLADAYAATEVLRR
jgi:AcrR family transcriptional regulator